VAFTGTRVGNGRALLDANGFRLSAATLPGYEWRQQHDAIKCSGDGHASEPLTKFMAFLLISSLRRATAILMLFHTTHDCRMFSAYWRSISGSTILEVKTPHVGASTYTPNSERCFAVRCRARAVLSEYVAKARAGVWWSFRWCSRASRTPAARPPTVTFWHSFLELAARPPRT